MSAAGEQRPAPLADGSTLLARWRAGLPPPPAPPQPEEDE